MNPSEPLLVDTLLSFLVFNEQGEVTITKDANTLIIKKSDDGFTLI